MGPPASLPNFRQLAERIAENTGCQPEAPYDQFLGKLADDAVDVHTLCRDIIRDSGSSTTPLHRSLLHLFREPKRLRIVTTNFDLHFTTAAKEGELHFPQYRAPALPLGHDFSGIVYLHGNILDE